MSVPPPDSVLDHLLKNQSMLVEKVSEMEKSSAVIAVEMRMLREQMEYFIKLEQRTRDLERWVDEQKGQTGVHKWLVGAIFPAIVALIVTLVSKSIE